MGAIMHHREMANARQEGTASRMCDNHPHCLPAREGLTYLQRERLDALSGPRLFRGIRYLWWLPKAMPLATGLPFMLAQIVLAATAVVGLLYLVFVALPTWHLWWILWGAGGGIAGALGLAIVRDACAAERRYRPDGPGREEEES
jgi:hypothetical protein